jgi:hypothetical protein
VAVGNKETEKLAKTPDDEELGGDAVWLVGPLGLGDAAGDNVGVEAQGVGVPDWEG